MPLSSDRSSALRSRAKAAVETLEQHDLHPEQASLRLGGHVATRTLYRWKEGNTTPQREASLRLVEDLVKTVCQEAALPIPPNTSPDVTCTKSIEQHNAHSRTGH